MSYNVFKRVKRTCHNKKYEESELLKAIKEFYSTMEKELKNESENYDIVDSFYYQEIYEESPYIRAINNIKEDDKIILERLAKAFKTTAGILPDDIRNDRSPLQWKI